MLRYYLIVSFFQFIDPRVGVIIRVSLPCVVIRIYSTALLEKRKPLANGTGKGFRYGWIIAGSASAPVLSVSGDS